MREFRNQLREARKAQHLTQRQLGVQLGIPQSYISKIEVGKADIRLSNLQEIAKALGEDEPEFGGTNAALIFKRFEA